MEQEKISPGPSWGRLLAFGLGGGMLGAITSGLVTTFQFTKIYPGGLEALSGMERLVTYLLTMFVGVSVGAANGVCKALYGKSLWRILLGV
jgi:hypothetical protein